MALLTILGEHPLSCCRVRAGGLLACLLATTACGPVRSLIVEAPDVINPVCLGSAVGIGATPAVRQVSPLSNRLSAENTTYATGVGSVSRWKNINVFQENVMEQVKGSRRRAVNDLTLDVTNLHVNALFYITSKLFVEVHGTVVELE